MPLTVILDEGEVRITGFRIELDVGFRVPRRKDGLLEGQLLGGLAFHPIIAITANSNDGAVRIELLHTLIETLLEPNLSGDAPGRALIPVLVVAHEQQIIGDLNVGSIRPVIVVERYGEHNGKAALGESLRHFCKKGLKVLLRPRRDFLEVNGQSLKLIRLEKRDDL